MPSETRWFAKAAIVYLALTFAVTLWMLPLGRERLAILLDIAALAQLAAIVVFGSIAWTRIRPAMTERFGTRA